MGLTDFTTIYVRKETRDKLIEIKYKYRLKSIDEAIRFLIDQKPIMNDNIETKARELIYKVCVDLGEEAKFFPLFIVKRYKISDPAIVEYFKSINNQEISCANVLSTQ